MTATRHRVITHTVTNAIAQRIRQLLDEADRLEATAPDPNPDDRADIADMNLAWIIARIGPHHTRQAAQALRHHATRTARRTRR